MFLTDHTFRYICIFVIYLFFEFQNVFFDVVSCIISKLNVEKDFIFV